MRVVARTARGNANGFDAMLPGPGFGAGTELVADAAAALAVFHYQATDKSKGRRLQTAFDGDFDPACNYIARQDILSGGVIIDDCNEGGLLAGRTAHSLDPLANFGGRALVTELRSEQTDSFGMAGSIARVVMAAAGDCIGSAKHLCIAPIGQVPMLYAAGRMKEIYVTDLAGFDESRVFDSFFLVLGKQQRTTKQNKPYLNLMLGDKTGQLEARVWDLADPRIARDFDRGDTVKVRGCVTRFDERCQIKVELLRKALPGDEVEQRDLLPCTKHDIEVLWARLEATVESLANPDLKRLVTTVLADPAIAQAYREAPAARQLHHAWLGGLLEHVVSLLGLAERVAAHYPLLDRDLLLTGVILHDIGKIRELSWATGFDYTVDGVLLGHIQMGVDLVEKTIAGMPDFPPRLRTLVLHLILSHHGKLEFGSPKVPMIPEALALNFVDDFDAKMMAVESAFEKAAREGRAADELTGKVWTLENRQLLNTRKWLEGE